MAHTPLLGKYVYQSFVVLSGKPSATATTRSPLIQNPIAMHSHHI